MPHSVPLRVVGIGPGDASLLTPLAREALKSSRCVVGYQTYLDLLPPELKFGKKLVATGMRQEAERVTKAIEAASAGEPTSIVCSGDPGIYAMASLVIELTEAKGLTSALALDIIPGVPALCAAAARLGAPIGHDFACVSLSDLLTPLDKIFRRVELALQGDFVLVLYNPRSRGRPDYLARALELARQWREPDCPVGLARNVWRENEKFQIFRLSDFDASMADMLSIIFIGACESRRVGPYMLTPRGYAKRRFNGLASKNCGKMGDE